MTTPRFKGDNGSFFTRQLFLELSPDPDLKYALYTLKDEDVGQYPSIKRLFIELGDETEYVFASTYFHSWKHYKKLLEVDWFSNVMTEAREELSLKLAAQNLLEIRAKAKSGDIKANQYLLEKKWLPQDKNSVGRPSKEKIKKEAENLFREASDINDDFGRILSFNK